MDARHVGILGEPPGGVTGIPITAVEELVFRPLPPDQTQGVFRPFAEGAHEMFLVDDVPPAAGNTEHAHAFIADGAPGLGLKAARPDIDLKAVPGGFLGEFQPVDHPTVCIRRDERRLGDDVAGR